MITPDARQVRAQIAADWSQAAAAWARWEPNIHAFLAPVGERMLVDARLRPRQRILDVGSGTGDPALSIARLVQPGGVVIALDLSPQMLGVARMRADLLGLTHLAGVCASGDAPPFAPASFDAISARFSVIFFPDVPAGLRRLGELLKPAGIITASAWAGPELNLAFGIPMQALRSVTGGPGPQPDIPGPLRLSRPGELHQAFVDAGFSDICVTEVRTYQCAPSFEVYWSMVQEASTQFRKQLAPLADDQRRAVRAEFERLLRPFEREGGVRVPGCARVATAVRP